MRFVTSIFLVTSILSTSAFAKAVLCEEDAKTFAANDYIATMGAVQSPDGHLDRQSQLVTSLPGEMRFEVAINDMSPEGDAWSFLYEVVLKHEKQTATCSLVSLQNLEVSD